MKFNWTFWIGIHSQATCELCTIILFVGMPYCKSDYDIIGETWLLYAPPIGKIILKLSQEVLRILPQLTTTTC